MNSVRIWMRWFNSSTVHLRWSKGPKLRASHKLCPTVRTYWGHCPYHLGLLFTGSWFNCSTNCTELACGLSEIIWELPTMPDLHSLWQHHSRSSLDGKLLREHHPECFINTQTNNARTDLQAQVHHCDLGCSIWNHVTSVHLLPKWSLTNQFCEGGCTRVSSRCLHTTHTHTPRKNCHSSLH